MREVTNIGAGPYPRWKRVNLGNHTITVYTIGWLSFFAQLAPVTLRLWERNKILPKPILKVPGGVRYYTALEISEYKRLIEQHYTSGRDIRMLRQEFILAAKQVRETYTNYGKQSKQNVSLENLPVNLNLIKKKRHESRIEKALEKHSAAHDKTEPRTKHKAVG